MKELKNDANNGIFFLSFWDAEFTYLVNFDLAAIENLQIGNCIF